MGTVAVVLGGILRCFRSCISCLVHQRDVAVSLTIMYCSVFRWKNEEGMMFVDECVV